MSEWEHLRVVLAIHRGGSMQAAAEALSIDRTTVLRRLEGIEAQMGARLFERSSTGSRLTPKGDEIVRLAENVERAMNGLRRKSGRSGGTARETVTVTVPDFFAANLLVPELPAFREAHPEIELHLRCSYAHLNLVRGEADIGLRNRWPEQASLIARKVASVGYAFYASQDYLARRGHPAGSFAGHDLILLGDTLATMLGYDRMMRLSSEGRIVLRSDDILSMVNAASAGIGIAYLPCLAVHRRPELSGVWPGLGDGLRDIFLVAHEDIHHQRHIRAVYDFMAALCTRLGPVIAGREVSDMFPPG
jgi:DNA-binding transcriptional LysR family regulator